MKTLVATKTSRQASYIIPAPVNQPAPTKQMSTDEREFENWKAQNGFSKPLTDIEFFNIYGYWR